MEIWNKPPLKLGSNSWPFYPGFSLFLVFKNPIVQTLNKSACCFLTWLSLAPFELKNNGQWLQGMEPSGIIPCEADMCLLSQNVLHKLCPHISHLLLLCMLYLWSFRACGVPKAPFSLSSHWEYYFDIWCNLRKFKTNFNSSWTQAHNLFVQNQFML